MLKANEQAICPGCSAELDVATPVEGPALCISKDDFSMCAYCGTFLRFNTDLTVRRATDFDLSSLTSKQLSMMVAAQRIVREKK